MAALTDQPLAPQFLRQQPIPQKGNIMILFLDFDGVLHPENTNRKSDLLTRLPLIEDVLREFPSAEIVISSAWRLNWPHHTLATLELRRHFSEDVAPRVIGVTPNFTQLDRQNAPDGLHLYRRQWECEMWLRANRLPGTPWVALDDRAYWFRPFCKNLMAFDNNVAFTPEQQPDFRARLKAMQEGLS